MREKRPTFEEQREFRAPRMYEREQRHGREEQRPSERERFARGEELGPQYERALAREASGYAGGAAAGAGAVYGAEQPSLVEKLKEGVSDLGQKISGRTTDEYGAGKLIVILFCTVCF